MGIAHTTVALNGTGGYDGILKNPPIVWKGK